jgi:mono/diheme cytochrome c family protein
MTPTLATLGCAFALGCGVPAGVLTPETAARLEVHPVDWNPRHEPIGAVTGAIDLGSDVVVFSQGSTALLSDGVATIEKRALYAGAIAPAPDGSGSWVTSLDDHGRVFRLRARRTFEPVSDRYGLEGKDVRALAGFGSRYLAFLLAGDEVAVADGMTVTHFDLKSAGPLTRSIAFGVGGRGVNAWVSSAHEVTMFDPVLQVTRSYALDNPLVASTGDHVFVASKRAIYEQTKKGTLALRYETHDDVRALVASNDHVWFIDDGELGVVTETGVSRTHGASQRGSRLVGSQSGDVWSIDSHGTLARWAVGPAAARSGAVAWADVIAPIYARACASCHAPEGASGVDLSKEGAWRMKRDLLRQRVVTDHDMPPQGHALSDADRGALQRWIDARDGS